MDKLSKTNEQIAFSAANDWCRCFKCDNLINDFGVWDKCERPNCTCSQWRDAYKGAMIALDKGGKEYTAPQWISVKDALPEIDQEVIVLSDVFNGVYRKDTNVISFGHRPNPEGYTAKSVLTGRVKHYDAVTYDGWNIPGVTHWMPCPELPDDKEK